MAAKAGAKKKTTTAKSKLAAAKKKVAAKKTTAKKPAAKKTVAKKPAAPKKKTTAASKAKPATKRKKAIGFEVMPSYVTKINKEYEAMQKLFDGVAEELVDFLYEGNKKSATNSRAKFQDITKSCKSIRAAIQEAKTKLKPIYKED